MQIESRSVYTAVPDGALPHTVPGLSYCSSMSEAKMVATPHDGGGGDGGGGGLGGAGPGGGGPMGGPAHPSHGDEEARPYWYVAIQPVLAQSSRAWDLKPQIGHNIVTQAQISMG